MACLNLTRRFLTAGRTLIAEPDVTLTDFGLAIESGILAVLLTRKRPQPPSLSPRGWLVTFFVSTGGAALLGGIDHGFLRDPAGTGHAIVWPASLLAIGVSSLAIWSIAAEIQFAPSVARRLGYAGKLAFVSYSGVVLLVDQQFIYAVGLYLPAASALLIVLWLAYVRHQEPALLVGIASIALTFLAAGVQVGRIGVHPQLFNHNALYHAIQAVALLLFWYSAVRMVDSSALITAAHTSADGRSREPRNGGRTGSSNAR